VSRLCPAGVLAAYDQPRMMANGQLTTTRQEERRLPANTVTPHLPEPGPTQSPIKTAANWVLLLRVE
jgi:hypothetical protein